MNIAEILKKCQGGMKLYSPIVGEVKFVTAKYSEDFPICCEASEGVYVLYLSDGRYAEYSNAECMLFPSKDQRDWKQFVVPDLKPERQIKPFERVLSRHNDYGAWRCNIFSHIDKDGHYVCVDGFVAQCIPYKGNEKLLGTSNKPE